MTTETITLTPGAVLGLSDEKTIWSADPEDLQISSFDTGVFINEMAKLEILPAKLHDVTNNDKLNLMKNPETLLVKAQAQAPDSLKEGTYSGTQRALTKVYELIERRYSSFMDTVNFEPTVPSPLSMEEKYKFFAFTDGSDGYPPHLNLAGNKPAAEAEASDVQKFTLSSSQIFSKMRLAQLSTLLPTVVPKTFIEGFKQIGLSMAGEVANALLGGMGTPDAGEKLEDIEEYNRTMRAKRSMNDIYNLPNVGDLEDWFADARFAQQHFTGTNPTTIERASEQWILHFTGASQDLADKGAQEVVKALGYRSPDSLYVQDYSYFREAAEMDESAIIKCEFKETYKEGGRIKTRESHRYGCASVCLFYLNDSGMLQPLSIVIDWRGSADKSVTIYNRELIKRDSYFQSVIAEAGEKGEESKTIDQAHDWAWRYAKTCVQTSDWLRHEVTVHLTNTHLIEESIIVAANRRLPSEHLVFRLLYPHWQKTLALNAAARDTLVPHVILNLIGFEKPQALKFIKHAYENFDFKGQYVPNDLRRRGFPPELLNDRKYHNYAYARCIYRMWYKIRNYVAEMLSIKYAGPNADAQVKGDVDVQAWSAEMRKPPTEGGADLKSFPTLSTLNELIDCVTMCIHIASPQHTAVNYLQNYYHSFVVNKPACLYSAPPTSLSQLLGYTESDLVAALPMNHPHDWLLSSHIPYLLSFKPGDKESLIIYAASKYHVYKYKRGQDEIRTKEAAARFYKALADSEKEFEQYGKETDDSDKIKYEVLSPAWNAVSILI